MGNFTQQFEYAQRVKSRVKKNKTMAKIQSDIKNGIPVLYETYMQVISQLPEVFGEHEIAMLMKWNSIPTEVHNGYIKEVEDMDKEGKLTNTNQMENLWLKWYREYNVPFYAF